MSDEIINEDNVNKEKNLANFVEVLKASNVIFFDCDGTLFPSEEIWNESALQVLKDLGVDPNKEQQEDGEWKPADHWKVFRGTEAAKAGGKNLFVAFSNSILKTYEDKLKGVTPEQFEEKMRKYSLAALKTVHYKDNAEKLLQAFKDNGVKLVLVTMAEGEMIDALLNNEESVKAGINKAFDVVIHGDMLPEGTKGKPDPACYLMAVEKVKDLACEQLAEDPSNKQAKKILTPGGLTTAAFEDTKGGVEAALSAYLLICAVPSKDGEPVKENAAQEAGISVNNYGRLLKEYENCEEE